MPLVIIAEHGSKATSSSHFRWQATYEPPTEEAQRPLRPTCTVGGATELVALPTGVVAPVPSLGPVIDSFGRFCADLLPCKSTGAGSALHRADSSLRSWLGTYDTTAVTGLLSNSAWPSFPSTLAAASPLLLAGIVVMPGRCSRRKPFSALCRYR